MQYVIMYVFVSLGTAKPSVLHNLQQADDVVIRNQVVLRGLWTFKKCFVMPIVLLAGSVGEYLKYKYLKYSREKLHLTTTFNFIVDVSATAVAFFGMVLITSVRHQMSLRTACHRYGKVDRTPRLCSSTCHRARHHSQPCHRLGPGQGRRQRK